MFKRIIIELTEPVCKCEVQDLNWSVPDGLSLKIECKKCKTFLVVGTDAFKAAIVFDQPYPKIKKDEPRTFPGNVIDMFKKPSA